LSVLNALKWSFLGELAAKAIQPIVFIVLARLLAPEDFGVMTAALMVIGFSQIFWEAGMGKALIQRQKDIEEAANAAFWINMCFGGLIAGLLYLFAQSIAHIFFQDERVTAVLEVMTLQILLGASSSVHTALLLKEMNFKKLFWVRFSTVSMPGIASIPLALCGWGYWALVCGALLGQFAQVVMLWRLSRWKPKIQISKQVTREISIFGAWVSATGLLNWFYAWGDTLVIGRFLGMHDLGLYRMGHQFSDLIYVIIFSPILPVLYSYLSLISHDLRHMSFLVERMLKLTMWISFPVGAFLFIFGGSIERLAFGSEWAGLGIVICYLSLRQSFAWMSSVNGEVYRAIGRPQYESIILLASLVIYIPSYLILAKINLTAFVYGRLVLVIMSMMCHLWLICMILKLSIRSLLSYGCLIIGLGFVFAMSANFVTIFFHMSELLGLVLSFTASFFSLIISFVLLGQNSLLKELKICFSRSS